jgi:hypothetical protein
MGREIRRDRGKTSEKRKPEGIAILVYSSNISKEIG